MFNTCDFNRPDPTTFQSAVRFVVPSAGMAQWLTMSGGYPAPGNAPLPAPVLQGTPTPTSWVTAWTIGPFSFRLTQSVCGPDTDCGSTLRQVYQIRNNSNVSHELCLARYADTDLGAAANDRGGAAAELMTLLPSPLPPFRSSDEHVFAFDQTDFAESVYAITAEGLDAFDRPAASAGWEVGAYPGVLNALASMGCVALTRTLQNDANQDLLVFPPEVAYDVTMGIGVRMRIAATETVVYTTRTRLMRRGPRGTRDLGSIAMSGNTNQNAGPIADVLKVNGSAGGVDRTVNVALNAPIVVQVDTPPGGPTPSIAWLFLDLGSPTNGSLIGHPIAADAADWFLATSPPLPPIFFGTAAFPSFFGGGGCALQGVSLAIYRTGVPAFGLPAGLPSPLSVTLQGLIFDASNTNLLHVGLTNAVRVNIGIP
jgi:hypothetical protein